MGEYTAVAVTDVHVNWRAGAMLLQHCHDVPEALTAERAMVGRMGDLLLGIHQRLASSLRQLAAVVGLQSAHELLGCNILYHSLPFACICAGTHLSILAVTAFVRVRSAQPSQSLSFSRSLFIRSSQLARHTHGRGTQLSLCCIGFGSPRRLGARITREKLTSSAATAATGAA
jgi:hypothetical protein